MVFSTKSAIFFLLLALICAISNAKKSPPKPKAFNFPIKKDDTANQYFTTIQVGSNATTFNVVIDLGGMFLWFNSLDYFNSASSYHAISCEAPLCKIIDGGCIFCAYKPPLPKCRNSTCAANALNPFSGMQGYNGLGQDKFHLHSTGGDKYTMRRFPFQFSAPELLGGVANSTVGLIGLGRTILSLQAQLASTFKIPQILSLCIPSSRNNGNLVVGQKASNAEISKSLITTPLIKNPVSTWPGDGVGNLSVEYFISLKSIRVDNKILSFNTSLLSIDKNTGAGGTSLRTVRPYTGLVRPIYRVLVKEFVKAAMSKNITRVTAVAPFAACFDTKTIGSSKTGPQVPIIDLVLESNSNTSVNWRFYGSNSMVMISNNTTCLAFVEVEPNTTGPTTSIVVGGYQMENYLLEFDLPSSELRFSPSLHLLDTSCSKFRSS